MQIIKSLKYMAYLALAILLFLPAACSRAGGNEKVAAKLLYRDPVFDGAADPSLVWNSSENKWFMFYTNRRANVTGLEGVSWVHDTRIGIADSSDGGCTWTYRDTCDIRYRRGEYTHWAPEVIEYNGLYHMYLTYVPGIFTNWKHPRWIIHLSSGNLCDWNFESRLELASDKCIDACIFRMPDETGRVRDRSCFSGKGSTRTLLSAYKGPGSFISLIRGEPKRTKAGMITRQGEAVYRLQNSNTGMGKFSVTGINPYT